MSLSFVLHFIMKLVKNKPAHNYRTKCDATAQYDDDDDNSVLQCNYIDYIDYKMVK